MTELLLRLTQNIILRALTVEAVQDFLQKAVDAARQGAEKTDWKVDDWIVEFLENIVKDAEKVELLINRVKELLQIRNGRVCLSPDADVYTQYLLTCYFTGYEPLEREVALTRSLVEFFAEAEADAAKKQVQEEVKEAAKAALAEE